MKQMLALVLSLTIPSMAGEVAKVVPPPIVVQAPSVADTLSYETCASRIKVLEDSVALETRRLDSATTVSQNKMPALAPKNEFEKQADFDKRKAEWDAKLAATIKAEADSIHARVEHLGKAKQALTTRQSTLLGTITVASNPAGASVIAGKEKGNTPATFSGIIPGKDSLYVMLEGYMPIDTVVTVAPSGKVALLLTLVEKGMFSAKDEIDIAQILKKDTDSAPVYQARIHKIRARQDQVDAELKALLANLATQIPPLLAQQSGESNKDFNERKTVWEKASAKKHKVLEDKYVVYWERLDHAADILKDYITQIESRRIKETPKTATLSLGKYDAEKELFDFELLDTTSKTSPFIFRGKVAIPLQVAKAMNRNTEGFTSEIEYINYPFMVGDSSVNLAMAKLSMSHKAVPVSVEGQFVGIPKYWNVAGYYAWKGHADSLLNGSLKSRHLDDSYLTTWTATLRPVAPKSKKGLSWKGWTRIALGGAAAVFTSVGIYENQKAADEAGRAHPTTLDQANQIKSHIQSRDDMRNAMWVGDAVTVGFGLATFAF